MDFLDNLVLSVNDVLYAYVLIILLVGLGIWFTFRTGFVQLRCIKEMVRLLCTNVGASTEKNHISTPALYQCWCINREKPYFPVPGFLYQYCFPRRRWQYRRYRHCHYRRRPGCNFLDVGNGTYRLRYRLC